MTVVVAIVLYVIAVLVVLILAGGGRGGDEHYALLLRRMHDAPREPAGALRPEDYLSPWYKHPKDPARTPADTRGHGAVPR
jgi:hypothetical protein